MKMLLKPLLVAFTLTLITFSASLADVYLSFDRPKKAAAFESSLYTTAEGKLRIALNKETGGPVLVQLTNRAGTELFVQQVGKRHQTARLLLDISALPDGVYQVSITNGVETTTQELTLVTTRQPVVAPRLVAVH